MKKRQQIKFIFEAKKNLIDPYIRGDYEGYLMQLIINSNYTIEDCEPRSFILKSNGVDAGNLVNQIFGIGNTIVSFSGHIKKNTQEISCAIFRELREIEIVDWLRNKMIFADSYVFLGEDDFNMLVKRFRGKSDVFDRNYDEALSISNLDWGDDEDYRDPYLNY